MSGQRGGQAVPPAVPAASATPGFVSSYDQVKFFVFNGMDTKSPRPHVGDQMCWWIDGVMPVGPSELRILPGIGPYIWTAPAGTTIVWHAYGNIGSSKLETTGVIRGDRYYAVVLLSDGSMWAINTDTPSDVRQIMAPGTILRPRTQIGFSQWGNEFFLIAKDQTDGYWLWDEDNTFTSGTYSPIIAITSGGDNYSSPPTVQVQSTNPNATPPTFQTFLAPGEDAVERIVVTSPGSGYTVDDFAINKFSGGGGDTTAWLDTVIEAGGGLKMIVVTQGGHGYTSAATITISGGGGTGASAALNIQNGTIISVTILSPGHGYTSIPDLTVTDPGYTGVPGGSGADGYPVIGAQGIGEVVVTNGGSGYTMVPDVEIIGDGHGALFRARIGGGVVTDVQLVNPGEGYTVALAQITGGNTAAEASNWQENLFPFGWSGTAIETFLSRAWISNGSAEADWPPRNRLIWTEPENPAGAGAGSGATVATDSFTRVGWRSLRQAIGFLYLIGDSSINVITNVQTTTTGQQQGTATTPADPGITTTSFSNQNMDPQLGSPWPGSVQLLSRVLYFANSQGVYAAYGGAVEKLSFPLDGVFYLADAIYGRDADFSSAVAQIFGIQVYCLLIPHFSLSTGQNELSMFMYTREPGGGQGTGKWFSSGQDVQLTWIASQEIQSQMVAWGTDGTHLFRLFQNPSTNFRKTVRSKFYELPGIDWNKTGARLYGVFNDFPLDQPVFVDIENSLAAQGVPPVNDPGSPGFAGSYPSGSYRVTLNSNDPGMQNAGTAVWGPYSVGQQGRLIGLTLTTQASQGNLVSLVLRAQDFQFLE